MKTINLSISFCFHDSSITFSNEREILIHLEYPKYRQIKNCRFKTLDEVDEFVNYGLNLLQLTIDDIKYVYVTKWNNLYEEDYGKILNKEFKFIMTSHHENHIGTILPFNLNKSVILCADGGSEDGYSKIYYKDNEKIRLVENLDDTILTGKFYGTLAQLLLEPIPSKAHTSGVGKLSNLSGYGAYNGLINDKIKDNSSNINRLYFDTKNLLPLKIKLGLDPKSYKITNQTKDFSYNGHQIWIENALKIIKKHKNFSQNICLVGGCALNADLNLQIKKSGYYKNVYTSPVSSDLGQSLGALMFHNPNLRCKYPFLGEGKENYTDFDTKIFDDILANKIIGWYQGRAEIGERSLGHRSILASPNTLYTKDKINTLKSRDNYQALACIIPEKFVGEYFMESFSSPYMTSLYTAREITIEKAPSIVHVNGTSLVQTINKKENPILYNILIELLNYDHLPILINTSLNLKGNPMVNNIKQAKKLYNNEPNLDSLYIDGIKYSKNIKKISLLVATYNNQSNLNELLESLTSASVLKNPNIEVIIIENHNSKSVFNNTKKMEEKYNVKVYHESKQGKSAALNKGIAKASGEFIVSTDDDVIVTDKNWLTKMKMEFDKDPNLGYLSGNVIELSETSNEYSNLWEEKGGLSKGRVSKNWNQKYLSKFKYKIFPWPLHKICAGANQMIRRDILIEIGGYSEFLGTDKGVDGLTLEIGYKVAAAGYNLKYNPDVFVYHKHPTSKRILKQKLYYYGKQDTGVSMYIFLKHRDFRYLWWSLFGHTFYTINKIIKSVFNLYPLPISYLINGLLGNIVGTYIAIWRYFIYVKK